MDEKSLTTRGSTRSHIKGDKWVDAMAVVYEFLVAHGNENNDYRVNLEMINGFWEIWLTRDIRDKVKESHSTDAAHVNVCAQSYNWASHSHSVNDRNSIVCKQHRLQEDG